MCLSNASLTRTSSEIVYEYYKVTIVLNNIGVTLLKSHRYKDALVAFRDAIRVMKSCSSSLTSASASSSSAVDNHDGNNYDDTFAPLDPEEVAQLVSNSAKAASRPLTCCNCSVEASSSSSFSDNITIYELHDESNPIHVVEILQQHSATTNSRTTPTLFVVSMYNVVDYTEFSQNDIDVAFGSLLYNYSQAALYHAIKLELQHAAQQYRNMFEAAIERAFGKANQFSEYSFFVFLPLLEVEDDNGCRSILQTNDKVVMTISLLALRNVMGTAITLRNHEKYIEYVEIFQTLLNVVNSSTYRNNLLLYKQAASVA